MTRGRKPLAQRSARITVKLSLRPGEDDDLLAFFTTLAPRHRALAVKTALRSGGLAHLHRADTAEADELNDALENFLE